MVWMSVRSRRGWNLTLYDGHCSCDAIQKDKKVAVIGAVVKGDSLHAYANGSMVVSAEPA